jgi:hypothetical protein
MLKAQLKTLGADGLCNSEGCCGCGADDLAPCSYLNTQCKAARHITPNPGDPDYDNDFSEGYYQEIDA